MKEAEIETKLGRRLQTASDAAEGVGSLRRELKRCQRELNESRVRFKRMGYTDALLAGENRLLKMVAGGSSLTEILTALCRLIEELSSGCVCSVVLVDSVHDRLEHGAAPS